MTYPTVEAQAVVVKAQEYMGTPWHHAGRVKGVGIDCIGLVVETYRALGVPVVDNPSYGMDDEFESLLGGLAEQCDQVIDELWPGDILVFRARLMWNHVGIYDGDGGMIHAYSSPTFMSVVAQTLDESWTDRRLVSVHRYRGVTWQH